MAKLFISYTRRRDADSKFANNLRNWLIEQGHAPWMDVYNIPAGANWDDEIDKALHAGDAVLGVVSSSSVDSDNVKNEWASAQDDDRLELYLLRIEDCEIPYRFYRMDYIDFTKEPQAGWTRLQTTLSQRFPAPGKQQPGVGKPKSAKSRNLLMNPIMWAAVGGTTLLVIVLIVIAVLSNGNNNGGGSAADNAESFVANFFSSDIDGALTYVCAEQDNNTRAVHQTLNDTLFFSGLTVTAQNIQCSEQGANQVQCNYTLVYSSGINEPVVVQ
ncbi:MAG: toll/interleukin-1 receptor domain-containing protein, partial [Chloroflexi bacterium]|nr:toll/interleukin-1 receptor domain-containing protein [Chloroflexota bacterium]